MKFSISKSLLVLQMILRRHWGIVLLALVLLYLLPPVWLAFAAAINAYGKVLDSAGALLKIPGQYIEKAKAVPAKIYAKVIQNPDIVWVAIIPIFGWFPRVGALLGAWKIMDGFKKPFTGTVQLYGAPSPAPPPVRDTL